MSDPKRDPLDAALSALPPDVPPERDLWPGIQAEIAKTPIVTDAAPVVHHSFLRWYQAAAAVLLVFATSVTTYFVTRESMQPPQVAETLPIPAVTVQPASFAAQSMLGERYVKTRAELDKAFEQRIATLPPATRIKLQRNLAELRHAADEIAATLAEHPSDPLLQELLVSTYQRELQFMSDVNNIPTQSPTRTDL
jgi:hypothetical protein